MLELGGDVNLSEKTIRAERRRELRAEHLDRYVTLVLEVLREIDRRHAAVAELALDTVAVGKRRLEAVQKLGDHGAPEKVPAYIRARTA